MLGGLSLCHPRLELFEPLNGVRILDDLDGIVLCFAVGDELEGGIVAEVLEALAGSPADVHCLDVLGREVVCSDGTLGLEFDAEVAHVAQLDAVASEELLAKTSHCIGQDALDCALRERRVVVGDVLAEVVEGELLVNLRRAVSLRLGDVRFQCSGLRAHNTNRIVNHSGPLPICLRRKWELAPLCGAEATFSGFSKVPSRPRGEEFCIPRRG